MTPKQHALVWRRAARLFQGISDGYVGHMSNTDMAFSIAYENAAEICRKIASEYERLAKPPIQKQRPTPPQDGA